MGVVSPRREEPPPGRGGGVDWAATLRDVAAGRGAWFRVAEYATQNSSSAARCHVIRRYDPAGRFEFAARKIDGKGVLYARLKTNQTK